MSRPNPVIPGSSLLSTRRTIGGVLHFSPDPLLNQTVGYTLGYLTQKLGIELHAFILLSNHLHAVYRDPEGRDPQFRQDLHSFLTRAFNCRPRRNVIRSEGLKG